MKLHFDLRENATRSQLLDTLLEAMDEDARKSFDYIVNHAVVPDKHHHSIGEVRGSIDALTVPDQVKADLHAVYEILATAEAKVHGCAVEETHFHEVGNASGICNALAICAAFYVLNPESVTATPIQPGAGEIECAHGILSLPAPATAAILEGLPLAEPRLQGERVTPTSAALIKHFVAAFAE